MAAGRAPRAPVRAALRPAARNRRRGPARGRRPDVVLTFDELDAPGQPAGPAPAGSAASARATGWRCCSTTRPTPTWPCSPCSRPARPTSRWTPAFPADRIAYIVADAGVAPVLSLSHLTDCSGARRRRPSTSTRRLGDLAGTDDGRLAAAETRRACRRARLHHLHLGLHRAAQGRGGRAPQHLQLRPGRRGGLRLPGRRPGLPGHDDRLRLLRRGDLGAAGLAGATLVPKPPGSAPARAGPARSSCVAQRVTAMCCVPTLLATLEEDLPDAAVPARLRRGLPARPDRALAPAGPPVPQRLRPDRGHGHRHLDRRRPGPRRHHRRPAARPTPRSSSTPRTRPGAAARGDRRDRHRRASGWPAATSTATTSPTRRSSRTSCGIARQPVGPDLPHRRPRPGQRPAARSSTTAGSTCRSRSAATGSS